MSAWEIYDALIDEASAKLKEPAVVSEIILGINWSVASLTSTRGLMQGICFSPRNAARTIAWSGTLEGEPANRILPWIYEWESAASTVGAAVLNAILNYQNDLIEKSQLLDLDAPNHLQVFEYFRPHLANQKVSIIGHYPGLNPFPEVQSWQVFERHLQTGDLPDTAAFYLLPESDWVFISASSIANKSLPMLLQLAKNCQVVLMGPSLPWSTLWFDFGVDYLAGVAIKSSTGIRSVAQQAGGTRLFDIGCEYRVLDLS